MSNEQKYKTSEQWYNELYPNREEIIMDPDGWDRRNWQWSFYEELVSKEEFEMRMMRSTCVGKNFFKKREK